MKVLIKGVKVLEKGNFYSKSTDKRSKSSLVKGNFYSESTEYIKVLAFTVKVLVKGVKVLIKGNLYC